MSDPYQILGINKNASDEQVKTAFINMQKKYHPDNYEDTPMKGYAKEKLDELTKAFDDIMNERRKNQAKRNGNPTVTTTAEDSGSQGYNQQGYNGNQGRSGQQGYQQSNNSQGNSGFSDVRRMIQQNLLVEAEEILDGTAQNARNAEWYFLKGTIFFSRGWVDDATNYFSTATRMDPNNREYQAALNRVMWQRQGNYGSGPNRQYRESTNPNGMQCTGCDICGGLLCADCCCECMGGDLISCC